MQAGTKLQGILCRSEHNEVCVGRVVMSDMRMHRTCPGSKLTKPHGEKLRPLHTDEVGLALIGNGLGKKCLSTTCMQTSVFGELMDIANRDCQPHCMRETCNNIN